MHHSLDKAVVSLWLVFLLQAGMKGPGKNLIEGSLGRTEEGFHYLIGRLVALTVNQFDKQFALGVSKFLLRGAKRNVEKG